jgi:hypothetical protein
VRLEAIAGADNPYSLLQVFGRGHVITKNGAVAYVTRCNPVEVLPRVSNNCTEEIPITWNGTSLYVDPISYVIKSAASPTMCNDIAPPRWKIAARWYCAYPSIRECALPRDLPVKPVNIEDKDVLDLGLSKAQVEEFLKFQDSQGIISPVKRASEAATDVAHRVTIEMESQAHMDDEKRRMAGYPSCDERRPQPLPALRTPAGY